MVSLGEATPRRIPAATLKLQLDKEICRLLWNGYVLPLSEKWVVFYALLAVNHERHVSTDEICDHHPWSRLSPSVAGRDLWRFTKTQEPELFGHRITSSPARQTSKLFTLALDTHVQIQFDPARPAISDHLRSLRIHRNMVAVELGECTLLLQSGLVTHALERLEALQDTPVSANEQAQILTLTTMCLEDQGGIEATTRQLPLLISALNLPGLNRLNRARLLVRVARYHTLKAHYDQAHSYFVILRSLLVPEDGVEYCWFHINYGVYLRRTGHLERAIHHQRLAHDVAQVAQWWHGVYSARFNLTLMHLSLAETSPAPLRQRLLQQALDWALRAHSTVTLTRQHLAIAQTAVLVARTYRLLGQTKEARHWLDNARRVNHHPELSLHLAVVWDEQALLEEQCGHHFYAHLAHAQAATCRGEQE
jgi:tetratricopeptide (TPR) repeat protein